MDAASFLSTIQGVAQANLPPGTKLATIDPAYTVGGSYPSSPDLPKVTFDGESTLSVKRYPVANGYVPVAGQRVLMIPAGRTYVIVGPITNTAPVLNSGTSILSSTGSAIGIDRPPGCKVRVSGTLSLVNNTNTLLPWSTSHTTKEYEVGGTWHNGGGGNPERLTVPSGMDGYYDISWAVTYPTAAGNLRIANLNKNGATITQGEPILEVSALFGTCISGQRSMVSAAAGDYFSVTYFQNSGGTINAVTDYAATFLAVIRRASL